MDNMVLYTPLSHEEIFPSEHKRHELVQYQGKLVYVKKTEIGEMQLVRLMSTDPQDYLNTSLQPGTMLSNEFIQFMK